MVIKEVLNNAALWLEDGETGAVAIVVKENIISGISLGEEYDLAQADYCIQYKNRTLLEYLRVLLRTTKSKFLLVALRLDIKIKELYPHRMTEGFLTSLLNGLNVNDPDLVQNKPPILPWEDISLVLPEETKAAKILVEWVRDELGFEMTGNAPTTLAVVMYSHRVDRNMVLEYDEQIMLLEITHVVSSQFSLSFQAETVAYRRTINYLKMFCLRKLNSRHLDEDPPYPEKQAYELRQKYPAETFCVEQIMTYLTDKYGYTFSLREEIFLLCVVVDLASGKRMKK